MLCFIGRLHNMRNDEAHFSYLISSSIAFAIASTLSLLPHPLRLLSESVFRLVPSCSSPQNLRCAMLSLLILADFSQFFGVVVPAVRDWCCVSLGGAQSFAAVAAAAAIDDRRLCCCWRRWFLSVAFVAASAASHWSRCHLTLLWRC